MALVRGSGKPFTLEDMAQMAAAVAADNFSPLHAKGVVDMSGDGSRDGIKISRPPTAGLELVVCRVERSIAPGAIVRALGRIVRVVLAASRALSALLAQDAKLFWVDACQQATRHGQLWMRNTKTDQDSGPPSTDRLIAGQGMTYFRSIPESCCWS